MCNICTCIRLHINTHTLSYTHTRAHTYTRIYDMCGPIRYVCVCVFIESEVVYIKSKSEVNKHTILCAAP